MTVAAAITSGERTQRGSNGGALDGLPLLLLHTERAAVAVAAIALYLYAEQGPVPVFGASGAIVYGLLTWLVLALLFRRRLSSLKAR